MNVELKYANGRMAEAKNRDCKLWERDIAAGFHGCIKVLRLVRKRIGWSTREVGALSEVWHCDLGRLCPRSEVL